MPPSNTADIAIAQEWLEEMDAYVQAHGLRGHDPFDVKQHPWLKAAQPNPFLRKSTSVLTDLFPHAARRMLHIEPTENPKAYALVALGLLRLYQITGDPAQLQRGQVCLQRLEELAVKDTGHLSWGYPFDVTGAGIAIPAGTPIAVVCAIAGRAFTEYAAATQEERYAEAAHATARFMLERLPRLQARDGTWCFAYAPTDLRRVHNAHLLVAGHLARTGALVNAPELVELAEAALPFTLNRQQENGAWAYGDWQEGDTVERGLMDLIDHHHTGFNLRALHGLEQIRPHKDVKEALQKGFAYYRTLFDPSGAPRTAHARYPVDIHACSEAILCGSILADTFLAAKPIAINTLRWAHFNMRSHSDGAPLYRKYPWFTSRITYPRWGLAWMYWALAEYLYHTAKR